MKRESIIIGIIIGLLAGLLISSLFFKSNIWKYQIYDEGNYAIMLDTKTGTYIFYSPKGEEAFSFGNFDEMLKTLKEEDREAVSDTISKQSRN